MPSDPGAPLQILCEDGPVLAVNKQAGLLTLGAVPGVPTLERQVKQYLKDKYHKPGNVYLGIPHRLDRPVSGVVVFARNSKAAARLAEQFRERQVRKIYWALVEGVPDPPEAELVDWLRKAGNEARVEIVSAGAAGARESRLRYRTLRSDAALLERVPATVCETNADPGMPSGGREPAELRSALSCQVREIPRTLLEVEPLTGRMHQIRVQLAARGWPIVGDVQYGAATFLGANRAADPRDEPIALHARSLTILHPIRYDRLTITAELPANWGTLAAE